MTSVLIVNEATIKSLVQPGRAIHDLIEDAFLALEQENIQMPSVLGMSLPDRNGEVDVKTAYWPGKDSFAIKVSPGFFDNPKLGLPSLSGLMVVLSAKTGFVEAVLLDNGYLTDVRTAAAGGVAARHLANPASDVGVIGAGMQARLQIAALFEEKPFSTLHVWAPRQEAVLRYKEDMEKQLGVEVIPEASAEALVKSSQTIVTATPAKEPLVQGEWLQPGHHITAVGSDSPEKRELDTSVITKADLIVVDRMDQSRTRGELRGPISEEGIQREQLRATDFGAILALKHPTRQNPEQITIADLTGTGIQDTAIAIFALEQVKKSGQGTVVEN